MKAFNTITAYLMMAAMTLGLSAGMPAIVYEHPDMVLSNWLRRDLDV